MSESMHITLEQVAREGKCKACPAKGRPTYRVGKRAVCANCAVREVTFVAGQTVTFGTLPQEVTT